MAGRSDPRQLQALREARKRNLLGPTQNAALQEIERRFMSFAEPAATMASAMVAEPVSGFVGLAATPFGSDVATRAINKTQEAMTYQPRTEAGMQGLQSLSNFMAPVGQAFEGASSFLGDAAFDATGSPALGAAAYSIPTMGLETLGLKAARAIPGRQFEMGDIGASGIGRSQRGAVGGVTAKPSTVKDVTAAWESRGIKSFVSEQPDNLVLGKIIVPEGQRSSGAGTQAMQELVDYADSTGKRIDLSPSADFGGNKKRLSEFYKRFGFVDNKGKAKDFEVSESMYRNPSQAGAPSTGAKIPDMPEGRVMNAEPGGKLTFVETPDGRVQMYNPNRQQWKDVTDSPIAEKIKIKDAEIEAAGGQKAYAENIDRVAAERKAITLEQRADASKQRFDGDYKMQHTAPMLGDNPSGSDISSVMPDIYSGNAQNYYGTGAAYDAKAIAKIQSMKGRPNKEVTVYRAVPDGVSDISSGDWVTTTREYARDHIGADEGYKIISRKVKARELATDGNSIHEFGYDPSGN